MFLASQHEHGKDELARHDELDDEALAHGGSVGQRRAGVEAAGQDAVDERCGRDGAAVLGDCTYDEARKVKRARQV